MATKVILDENESIEVGLKNFRRIVQRDHILRDAKRNQYFSTRRAKLAAKKKNPKT